jgi:ankyrin repeat protein
LASETGKDEVIKLLLIRGALVNEKSNFGTTPFLEATENENHSCMQILLNNGAEINDKTNDGNTALHYASGMINYEGIKLLLAHNENEHRTRSMFIFERSEEWCQY